MCWMAGGDGLEAPSLEALGLILLRLTAMAPFALASGQEVLLTPIAAPVPFHTPA